MNHSFHLRLIAIATVMIAPGALSSQWANCSGTTSDTCKTQNVGIGTTSPAYSLHLPASYTIGIGSPDTIYSNGAALTTS